MSVNLLTEHHLEFLSLKKEAAQARLSPHFSNATLLEITYHGSYVCYIVFFRQQTMSTKTSAQEIQTMSSIAKVHKT